MNIPEIMVTSPHLTTTQTTTSGVAKSSAITEIFASTKKVNVEKPVFTNKIFLDPQNSASTLDVADIPLIDLNAIQKADEIERKLLIHDFGNGLRDVGFIAVKAPKTMIHLIKQVNEEMKIYFAQNVEDKEKDNHGNNGQTGFAKQGNETAANAKKADLKETYFIPPNFDKWPENNMNFETVMSKYHEEMTSIAAKVMGYVAEYLNEPTEDVSKSVSSAHNLIRLAHYPAPKETDDKEAVWAAAHEDLNALTLLPRSTIPGLQLLTKNNVWKLVDVPEGYLIVNTGEALQMKTAGYIKATRHQVLNPGGQYANVTRYASIFFASWSSEFSLKPFESCIEKVTNGMNEQEKQEYLKNYPDVTVNENLLSRLIEMSTIKNPDEELVKSLRSKGLLKQPPQHLVDMYPGIFAV